MTETIHKIGSLKSPDDLYSLNRYKLEIDFKGNPEIKLESIIDSYDFPKEHYIKCGIKECSQPHGKGYLVKTNQDTFTNIGNRCGTKLFGVNFKEAKTTFHKKEKAEKNLSSLTEIVNNCEVYQDRIDKLYKVATHLFKCRKEFYTLLPVQFKTVKEMVKRRDSNVYREQLLSAREYEIAKANDKNASRYQEIKIGEILYCDFFETDICEITKREIRKPFEDLKKSFKNIESLSQNKLTCLSKSVNDAISNLPLIEVVAAKGVKFFSERNLNNLSIIGASNRDINKLIIKSQEELKEYLSH